MEKFHLNSFCDVFCGQLLKFCINFCRALIGQVFNIKIACIKATFLQVAQQVQLFQLGVVVVEILSRRQIQNVLKILNAVELLKHSFGRIVTLHIVDNINRTYRRRATSIQSINRNENVLLKAIREVAGQERVLVYLTQKLRTVHKTAQHLPYYIFISHQSSSTSSRLNRAFLFGFSFFFPFTTTWACSLYARACSVIFAIIPAHLRSCSAQCWQLSA